MKTLFLLVLLVGTLSDDTNYIANLDIMDQDPPISLSSPLTTQPSSLSRTKPASLTLSTMRSN